MRIVVFSDSHTRENNVLEIIERHKDNANLFLFLGDGNSDVDTALMLYKSIRIERVNGNCDFYSCYPATKIIEFAGKKILMTHGHPYGVKHGLDGLIRQAKDYHIDICLYGHTHIEHNEIIDDILFFNPGTSSNGDYGIIDIENGKVMAYHTSV